MNEVSANLKITTSKLNSMKDVTFITGNQNKADYLSRLLDFPLKHVKIDLNEIQSLDLNEVVDYKIKQAYKKVKSPIIVEDVSLKFAAFGRLPGTFIKFSLKKFLWNLCVLWSMEKRGKLPPDVSLVILMEKS